MSDRLDFPATERNREAIFRVLDSRLPPRAHLLEVASGSGQHAAWMAAQRPDWRWQPSDPQARHRASIRAWSCELPNVLEPLDLDVLGEWPVGVYDAVLAINLIHVAPWEATPALMRGARQVLRPGGLLFMYGALKLVGCHTALSNEAFDRSLRGQDESWGVRDFEAVCQEAEKAGLELLERIAMPANNFSVWFTRPESPQSPLR